jgi:predicted nucleic acid-binding protein
MTISALADSSSLFAYLDTSSHKHDAVKAVMQMPGQRILLPTITLPEVMFLVRRNFGAHRVPQAIRFLRAEDMEWLDALPADYDRAAAIIERYPEARLDLVDATIAALAERLEVRRILTLDRRDFSVIRPTHCEAFEVLP